MTGYSPCDCLSGRQNFSIPCQWNLSRWHFWFGPPKDVNNTLQWHLNAFDSSGSSVAATSLKARLSHCCNNKWSDNCNPGTSFSMVCGLSVRSARKVTQFSCSVTVCGQELGSPLQGRVAAAGKGTTTRTPKEGFIERQCVAAPGPKP